MSRRELAAVLVVLSVGVALLAAFGGAVLWQRPLWFDELCCVSYVVNDATSPAQVVSRVAAGWDYAPPLLHLLLWPLARLAGGLTPEILRTFAVASVMIALTLVYATLRRRFAPWPSAAALIAVAANALVLEHAFEGRFYGPWLLFAAGFAWALGVGTQRRRDVAVALFALALCLIHWFGAVSLVLMLGGVAVIRRDRETMRRLAPGVVGLLGLALVAPMAFAQRAGTENILWVPELHAAQLLEMGRLFWFALPVLIAAGLLVLAAMRTGYRATADSAWREPSLLALLSLALMPLAMALISVALQPSMVPRYAIVAALAWAPLAAIAFTQVRGTVRVAGVLALAVTLVLGLHRHIRDKHEFADAVASRAGEYARAKSMGVPVVFWGLHNVYPVAGPDRAPTSPVRYLNLADSTLLRLFPSDAMAPVRKKYRLDRDQARGHARTYGFPMLASPAQLDSMPRFVLLAEDMSLPGGYKSAERFGRALVPGHQVVRLSPHLALFEQRRK